MPKKKNNEDLITNDKINCPTFHILDEPSEDDKFSDSHQKIAVAIEQLIQTTEVGHAIGIEGPWGSGKSTIIHLLKKIYKDNDNYKFIIIDAWAHEGDPLRRIFLDRLLKSVEPWIDDEEKRIKLADKIQGLAGPKEKEKPRKKLTWQWIVLFFLFSTLPISINMVVDQINNVSLFNPLYNKPNSPFIIGWTLIILFFVFLSFFVSRYNNKGDDSSFSIFQISTQPTNNLTINPSSIDFEECFKSILNDSIFCTKRKIIFVIDNIDRIEIQNAKGIINTLQTFIDKDNNNGDNKSIFDNIWVIIPFDFRSLSKIWNPNDDPKMREFSQAFFHKRFQTILKVPPIIKSNWKKFFLEKLAEEFYEHHDQVQFHHIYEIYNNYLINKTPSPREIIRFVNQIGIFHIIWQDKISLDDIASYLCDILNQDVICMNTTYEILLNKMLLNDFDTSDKKKIYLALYYNMDPDVAFQIHFSTQIRDILDQETYEELRNYHQICPEGFWCVFEEFEFIDLAKQNKLNQLSMINSLLDEFSEEHETSVIIRKKILNSLFNVNDWSFLQKEQINSFKTLFTSLTENQIKKVFLVLSKIEFIQSRLIDDALKIETREGLLTSWLLSIIQFIEITKDKLTNEKLIMDLPFTEKGLLEFLHVAIKCQIENDLLLHFTSKVPTDTLTNELVVNISANNLDPLCISIYKVCKEMGLKIEWDKIFDSINTKFSSNETERPQIEILLPFLFNIEEYEKGANALLVQFALSTKIYSLLQITNNNPIDKALIVFTIINYSAGQYSPSGTIQPTTQQGNLLLTDLFTTPSKHSEIFPLYANLVLDFCNASDFFAVYQYLIPKLFLDQILSILLASDGFCKSLSEILLINNWKIIKEVSDNNKYNSLLLSSTLLIDNIINSEFKDDDIDLYKDLINTINPKKKVKYSLWLSKHLNTLSEIQWIEYFDKGHKIISLLALINKNLSPVHLKMVFINAIEETSRKFIIDGEDKNEFLINWPSIKLSYPDERLFFASLKRILKIAVDSTEMPCDDFYTCFGEDLNQEEILLSNEYLVSSLFTFIVDEEDEFGLKWLLSIFTRFPNLLSEIKGQRDEIHDFKFRVFEKSEMLIANQSNIYAEIISKTKWRKPRV